MSITRSVNMVTVSFIRHKHLLKTKRLVFCYKDSVRFDNVFSNDTYSNRLPKPIVSFEASVSADCADLKDTQK